MRYLPCRRLAFGIAILMLVAILVPAQDGVQFGSRILKSYIRPVVPAIAQTMRLKGTVRLEVVISPAEKSLPSNPWGDTRCWLSRPR